MAHNLLYVLFLALPINKDSKGLPLADTVQGWHCIFCGSREVSLNRPSMRPSDSSLVKYSETTAGCSRANPMLTGADQRQMLSRKPIQNPYFSPMQTYRAKALSGYRDRAWAHTSTTSGVETGCSTAVAALTVRREKSRHSTYSVEGERWPGLLACTTLPLAACLLHTWINLIQQN